MSRKRRNNPQPPVKRWSRPTGVRRAWVALSVVAIGVAALVWGPWRTHDVFDDASLHMAEWQLVKAVTVGGPRRAPAAPSELNQAIRDFLGDQASDLATDEPEGPGKTQQRTSDDFCPT